MVTDVLITGYTEFISREFLTTAFPGCRLVITGNCPVKESDAEKISHFKGELTASACRNLFNTYEFSQVVFFSEGIAPFQRAESAELDLLSNVVGACYPETKIIYVAGPEHTPDQPQFVMENAAREISRHLAAKTAGISFLVSPWVYSIHQEKSQLTELFRPTVHKLEYAADQQVGFLAAEELAVLIFRMFEAWSPCEDPFYVPAGYTCTVAELAAGIQKVMGDRAPEFQFSNTALEEFHPSDGIVLRSRYLWYPVYSLADDLHIFADRLQTKDSRKQRFQLKSLNGRSIRILELLAVGVFCELLLQISNISVQFRMIDFRLLTIVVMGTVYNIPMGLAAAAMESVSLIWAYSKNGISWITLFHEPTNWLPFIAFFTVGAICGYIRSRDRSLLKFSQDENHSLKERYSYLLKVNDDVLREKQEYKQQIIGSRDSFGKIFNIAQQLNQSHPKHLLFKAVEVMETIIGGGSVAMYNCGTQQLYGRMAIASRGIGLPYSVCMTPYYNRLESVGEGEAWVNRTLEPDMPQFMYGVRKEGKIVMVILIQKTDFSQMTLYHENLFRVVCGLISNSLIRAMEYQEAVRLTHCAEGSQKVLTEAYFLEELEFASNTSEYKQASHLLLRVNAADSTLAEVEQKLEKCVRNTDVIGYIGNDLYVLLLQAHESDMAFISLRFTAADLEYALISQEEQSVLLKQEAKAL